MAAKIRDSAHGSLLADKTELLETCSSLKENFEKEETKHLVKRLVPKSPFVKYSMRPAQTGDRKHNGQRLSGRGVGTGKATADVDASAEEAAAWIFDMCSRERMRLNREDNANLPRVLKSSTGVSSVKSGTIKLMPFPFHAREFAIQMMWLRLNQDTVAVLVHPVDEFVDYGMDSSGVVRGSNTAFQLLKARGPLSCSIELYQKLDAGGKIPVSLVNSKIATALNTVNNLMIAFERHDEVDREKRRAMITEMNSCDDDPVGGGVRDYPGYEDKVVFESVSESVPETTGLLQKQAVEGGSDHFVKLYSVSPGVGRRMSLARRLSVGAVSARQTPITSKSRGGFVAEVTIDADTRDCVAWLSSKGSRQRTQLFFKNEGGAHRSEHVINKWHQEVVDTFLVGNPGGLQERATRSELLWKRRDNGAGYIVVERRMNSEDILSRHRLDGAENLGFIPATSSHLIQRLSADVDYVRQQGILHSELLPDVDVRRSEKELAFFVESDAILRLFDHVSSMDTVTYEEYPGLEFRWAH